MLKRPIRIQHAAAKCPSLPMTVRESDQFLEGVVMDNGVRIEDEHILALRHPNSGVVALGKAEVRSVRDDFHLAEMLPDVFERSVR